MATLTLESALSSLRHDRYCLWVGAGLTMHLAGAGRGVVPGWTELTSDLERLAGVPTACVGTSGTCQQRIDACLERLGWEKFQQQLRKLVLVPICESIIDLVTSTVASGEWVPNVARQLARLGQLANPIVNFNVESLTSIALADADGSTRLAAFSPNTPGAVQPVSISRSMHAQSERFERDVYHPHGSLDLSGICVMAERHYRDLEGNVSGGTAPNPVISWTCGNFENERFTTVGVEWHGMGNMCVEAVSGTLQLKTCNGSAAQSWDFFHPISTGYNNQIRLSGTNSCVSATTSTGALGQALTLVPCSTDSKQQFSRPGNGLLALTNNTALCANVAGGLPTPGSNIVLWDGCSSTPPFNSQFTIGGRIKSLNNCMQVDGSASPGVTVSAKACDANNKTTQLWEYYL